MRGAPGRDAERGPGFVGAWLRCAQEGFRVVLCLSKCLCFDAFPGRSSLALRSVVDASWTRLAHLQSRRFFYRTRPDVHVTCTCWRLNGGCELEASSIGMWISKHPVQHPDSFDALPDLSTGPAVGDIECTSAALAFCRHKWHLCATLFAPHAQLVRACSLHSCNSQCGHAFGP